MPFFSSFGSSFFAGRRSTAFSTFNLWGPSEESSLVAWWDASDPSTITTSGSTVTQISDKSGNSFNLSGTNTPTTTILNGLDAIDFEWNIF